MLLIYATPLRGTAHVQTSIVFLYGVTCYAVFFATYLYAIGFVGNLFVPRTIDSAPAGGFVVSLVVDLALLLGFAIQHSVMARPAFKHWLTRFIPEAAERSTYVLASSLALIALFAFWQPLGGTVWTVKDPTAATVLYVLCAFGWLLVLVSTFLINHFDLFGLRQVWLYLTGPLTRRSASGRRGRTASCVIRSTCGWLFAFWSTPTMTAAHLLFAVATTGYILIAIRLEERDLIVNLGDAYRQYRRRVPMLIPFTNGRSSRS